MAIIRDLVLHLICRSCGDSYEQRVDYVGPGSAPPVIRGLCPNCEDPHG